MIEAGRQTPDIVSALATEYEAAPSTIAADVTRLLGELEARGLIRDEVP
jgi:hypothetical protein